MTSKRPRQKPNRRQRLARKLRFATKAVERAAVKAVPNRVVTCSCGAKVRAHSLQAHLKTHRKQHRAARHRTETVSTRPRKPRPPARTAVDPTAPSRVEAGKSAAGWLAAGGVLVALPLDGIGSTWMIAAGAGCALIGGGAYASERRWGFTDHTNRETRRTVRKQARAAGCNSACMTSTLPTRTCHCPCGGSTHGTAQGGMAA